MEIEFRLRSPCWPLSCFGVWLVKPYGFVGHGFSRAVKRQGSTRLQPLSGIRVNATDDRRQNLIGEVVASALALVLACAALAAQKKPPSKPIDLNVANVKELQELPGVGQVTAQRIIDMRQKSGRFRRIEDLLAVRGISQTKLDALRPYVTVSSPAAALLCEESGSPPPTKRKAESSVSRQRLKPQ